MKTISKSNCSTNSFFEYPVRLLHFLMKKIGLKKLFQTHVKDPRYEGTTYPLSSLLMAGLLPFLFRSGSKNNFYQGQYQGCSCRALNHLVGIDTNRFPVVKTLDDLFAILNPKDLEPILFRLFKWLCVHKVIRCTPEMPCYLVIDAYQSHSYDDNSQHRHHVGLKGCPYCLPRKHKVRKGKKKENEKDKVKKYEIKTRYYHVNVVASIVFPNGFQFPLYIYRLKKHQQLYSASEGRFKQECELTALETILSTIRSYLPNTPFCLLLDALYCQNPTLETIEKYHMSYNIVLKGFSTSKELRSSLIAKKVMHVFENKRFKIEQYLSFCRVARKDRLLNVVDLFEVATKKPSKRLANVQLNKTHWQWLFHQTVTENNAVSLAKASRLRWREEDLFNTIKNRGFNATHDFSRHPQTSTIWMMLMLIAFAVTSLLLHTQLGQLIRRKQCSIRFFMEQMLQHLLYIPSERIFDCCYPKQLRFCICPQAG